MKSEKEGEGVWLDIFHGVSGLCRPCRGLLSLFCKVPTTPVVGYDLPSLRDSWQQGITAILES